ncbi:hypothetical protein PAMA_002929 [Pampus argenteus]
MASFSSASSLPLCLLFCFLPVCQGGVVQRGVPEESIQKMQQDHIDSSVIEEIDDATMASYIPAYGDRIATRRFCMEKQRRGGDDTKRLSLFKKLFLKMGTMSNKDSDQGFEGENTVQPTNMRLKSNKRAWKTTRKIELGWIHDDRFYLFTKTLTSGDDREEEADIQTDEQHENTTESGQVKHTMEEDEAMMTYSVKYSLIDEMGADADGVSRDVHVYAAFWTEFLDCAAEGADSERDLLSTALQEAVVGDDEEELLDLMDRMGVRTVPTPDNLRAVLVQVAHKQMIQHPKYALDNIAEVAGPILRKFFPSVQDMKKLYEDIKPTTRKKHTEAALQRHEAQMTFAARQSAANHEQALAAQVLQPSADYIIDDLVSHKIPSTLDGVKELATRIDLRIQAQRRER